MKFDSHIHGRRSIRLSNYDYSKDGAYFITICSKRRQNFFGKIRNKKMTLNNIGKQVEFCWFEIPKHFPFVKLDEFVVMPNHMHGIFMVEANNHSPVRNNYPSAGSNNHLPIQKSGTSKTVGSIIRGYKIGVTKWCRKNTNIHDIWHRNYYEHIIRNEEELERIREYIQSNPKNYEKKFFKS